MGIDIASHPQFLTTRETFPGERSFAELSAAFFGDRSAADRAGFIGRRWKGEGLLVHMANPEQLDDLFAHIDREKKVRFLSTSYIHDDIRPTVYAIGRGTGLLLDQDVVRIDHVSAKDSNTETAPGERLVACDDARVADIGTLHRLSSRGRSDEWNEVNVSFEGPGPIIGIFSLDGTLSKIYATILYLKSDRLLPVFTYNRERNELAQFVPGRAALGALIDSVPVPSLQDRYRLLLKAFD